MKSKTAVLAGAMAIFIIALSAGAYFYFGRGNTGPAGNGNATSTPASIKVFTVEGANFVAKGENLSRVEIWSETAGKQQLVGKANLETSGAGTAGDVWTMKIPGGLAGVSTIFARGFDQSGAPAARIDLQSQFLKLLK